MRHTWKLVLQMGILLVVVVNSGWPASIPLPVKRGQVVVDPKLLPLSCLGITTINAALPLERLILENLESKKKHTAVFGKSIGNKERNILTAVDAQPRSHSLAIMQLKPGTYRLLRLEFIVPGSTSSNMVFDLSKGGRHFTFTVNPNSVNYHGSIVINSNWSSIHLPKVNTYTGGYAESKFSSEIVTEETLLRDVKWVTDLIPGMAELPMINAQLVSD